MVDTTMTSKDERILGMSEIERETILYDRSKEVEELKEKDRLVARLKQRNAQQAADARTSAARRSARDVATPKSSAIQELKRKREAKSNKASKSTEESSSKRNKRDYYSSDDDEEADSDLGDEYSDGEADTPADRRLAEKGDRNKLDRAEDLEGSKDISFDDALQIRMSRKSCLKFMYYPQFPETAIGCFVRISIGSNDGKPVYRVCQVSSMQDGNRTYKLPTGEQCRRALECSHGSSVRTFEFTYISDAAFTKEEFDKWQDAMTKDKLRLMNKRKLNAKLIELKDMGSHALTDAEINVMIEEKQKLAKIPSNVAAEKIRLSGLIQEARDNRDDTKVEELQNELARFEELTSNRGRNGDLDKLSKLNARNRQQTGRAVGKAEIENANKRQKAELLGKSGGDPFSRLKTRPRTFYESTPNSSTPGSPSHEPSRGDEQSKQGSAAKKAKQLGGIDGLIG